MITNKQRRAWYQIIKYWGMFCAKLKTMITKQQQGVSYQNMIFGRVLFLLYLGAMECSRHNSAQENASS